MNVCTLCGRAFGNIEGCLVSHVKIGNKIYKRNKCSTLEYQCHDCGAGLGKFHHPGCDMEDCPKCRGQMIWCECIDDKEFIVK